MMTMRVVATLCTLGTWLAVLTQMVTFLLRRLTI